MNSPLIRSTHPGLINLDFADVRTIMHDVGSALMGIGKSGSRGCPDGDFESVAGRVAEDAP